MSETVIDVGYYVDKSDAELLQILMGEGYNVSLLPIKRNDEVLDCVRIESPNPGRTPLIVEKKDLATVVTVLGWYCYEA